MSGLHDADVRYDDLGAVTNFWLVSRWGVYPDVVLRCSSVVYSLLF